MGLDYYSILGIGRNARQLDIKKAYRRLALKYNPEKYEKDYSMEKVSALVAEAYEVLVDHKHRAVYDQYGEEGLKRGVPGPKEYIQPYVYHGQPLRTFHDFFGTRNPYADLLDYYDDPSPIYDSPLGKGYKVKDKDIVRPLALTLEEVYRGGIKKMKIQRLVFTDESCSELKLREKVLSIPFAPGIYANTEIRFSEEGDQGPTRIPADVVFVTEDRPHETYTRRGSSDLLTVHKITLQEALCGFTLTVKTLDDRTLRVNITDVITPGYEKIIEDEGLPVHQCPEKAKGYLIIQFKVTFPEYLSKKNKIALEKVFSGFEDETKFDRCNNIKLL